MAAQPGNDRQVRLSRITGLVFVVLGFVAILIGYNNMSYKACLDCMLPYIMSGGILGLGLIIFGVTLLLTASQRAERLAMQESMKELNRSMAMMGAAIETQESPNGRVVAGKSTYHRPDCRLVKGRENLDLITVKMAEASGLSACRVCGPATADAL